MQESDADVICQPLPVKRDPRFKDLTGKRFSRLVVIGFGGRKNGSTKWVCKCDCGKFVSAFAGNIKRGLTNSCGCYRTERTRKACGTHFDNGSAEYSSWSCIRTRCFNKNNKGFKSYGARGITMCPEWKDSYEAFLRDMGRRPSDDHSIERIDNDGNYEPANCRWATSEEQANNTRQNRFVIVNGERITTARLSKRLGLSPNCIASRLNCGW